MQKFLEPKTTLIVADGEKPEPALLDYHRQHAKMLIALDGAGTWLLDRHIVPDLVIGDLDSFIHVAGPPPKKMQVIDQESNDLEKSLQYCYEHNLTEISIIGAIGLRADHFLTNLFAMKKYAPSLMLTMSDTRQCAFMCPPEEEIYFDSMQGSFISLFPLGDRVGPIYSSGVQYPLDNQILSLQARVGTLNQIVTKRASISCVSPDLLIVVENPWYKNHQFDDK